MSILTSREVTAERVRAITFTPMSDALRNHLTTIAYVDLSNAMAELLGTDDASWTCLAVWPSFTVGTTIRADDDPTGLRRLTGRMPSDGDAARRQATGRALRGRSAGGRVLNRSLAAGNRGVFFEIGLAWTDFLDTFGPGGVAPAERQDAFADFCGRIDRIPLPPGKLWPEGERDRLKAGFEAYVSALDSLDLKSRAELVLLGNLRLADHEQRQLQGWLDLSMLDPVRTVGKPLARLGADGAAATIERLWSRLMTRRVFVVTMGDETVRVGRPVPPLSGDTRYPAPLHTLDHPEVRAEFERLTSGGEPETVGARHWNDIDDRMAFIASLFRARQRAGLVGRNPYSEREQQAIWAQAAEIAERDVAYGFEGPLLFPRSDDSPWPPEVVGTIAGSLEGLRQRCDDEADAVIDAFYRREGIPRADRHFTDVLIELANPGSPRPGPVTSFLRAEPQLPHWADLDRIARAQAFFETWRSPVHAALFFGAMFMSYAGANGVQVLSLVSDLTRSPERRLWESTRFYEDVMTTPFWEPTSAGWRSVRGVRMFHAAVRHTIDSGSQHITTSPRHPTDRVWDPAWGRPINQEDMLGFILTMSVPIVEILDRVGVPIDPDETRDFVHLWNVVGVLMGVEEELLRSPIDPSRDLSFEEARLLHDLILARNIAPSEAGRRLTEAAMVMLDDWFPRPLRSLPRAFIRLSIGDRTADMLGVPQRGLLEGGLERLQDGSRTARTSAAYQASMRRFTTWFGRQWLEWWAREYQDTPPFRQGGMAAVTERAPDPATRMPRQVTIAIDSLADLPPAVLDAIAGLDGVTVVPVPVGAGADEGFESLSLRSLFQGTVEAGASVRRLVETLRAATRELATVQGVELVIDGRSVPLSRLSDAEIEALLPELTG